MSTETNAALRAAAEAGGIYVQETMTLAELISRWRPGSHDTADGPEGANLAWTWADEAHDLFTRTPEYQAGIVNRVHRDGIDYGNRYGATILLGNDGRVWDGHHRIVAGLALGVDVAVVEIIRAALGDPQ